MKTLLIIPAYNEEDCITKVIDNLINNYPQYDYVIINDGSTDHTSEICHKKGYEIIDLPINLGLAGAFQTGLKYAYLKGYDFAMQMDADGQHLPEYDFQGYSCDNRNSYYGPYLWNAYVQSKYD